MAFLATPAEMTQHVPVSVTPPYEVTRYVQGDLDKSSFVSGNGQYSVSLLTPNSVPPSASKEDSLTDKSRDCLDRVQNGAPRISNFVGYTTMRGEIAGSRVQMKLQTYPPNVIGCEDVIKSIRFSSNASKGRVKIKSSAIFNPKSGKLSENSEIMSLSHRNASGLYALRSTVRVRFGSNGTRTHQPETKLVSFRGTFGAN